jgi:uncharacterized protein (TIGR03067 family)
MSFGEGVSMMKSIRVLAFALMVAVVLPVLAEEKNANKFETEKILGDWSVTAGKKAGTAVGDEGKKGTYTITKDKITLNADGKALFVFEYTLDTKTDPVSIDMTIADGPDPSFKGSKGKGIIELKGEELNLCYDPMGGERPKKFDDEKAYTFTMKKAKKEEKKEENSTEKKEEKQ